MSKKKILAIALSLVMVLSLIPHGIFAAAQDDNSWQIVSGKYVDNTTESKTAYPSTDPEIRIQKNVIPTAVENEFQVYMAIDAKCMEYTTSTKITEVLSDMTQLNALYTAGSANQYPSAYSGQEHTGNGSLAPNLAGSAKPCDPGDVRYKLVIIYEKDGQTYLIAEPILSLGVPNSTLYLKVGDDFIVLENIKHGTETPNGDLVWDEAEQCYIVPVRLTTMAFNALLSTHTESTTTTTSSLIIGTDGSASISDPMGGTNSFIVYDGFVSGDIVDGTAPAAATEPGTSVTWQLDPKPIAKPTDPSLITHEVSEETVTDEHGNSTTTTVISDAWWVENIVELTYKVHLAVDKAGFVSGTEYPVNGTTTLSYGNNKTATFTVPTVKGTLYDVNFKKVDDKGSALSGVTFTLSGPEGNPDVAKFTEDKTATSAADGTVSFEGLPWGTYTLTETAPSGYSGAAQMTLNIGYTSWPENVTHYDTANDVYKLNETGEVVNTLNTVTVNKAVEVYGDLTLAEVDHTIYIALQNKADDKYLTDASGNIIYKTITITGGVPSPSSVTFEGVPCGEYNVMELASVDPVKTLGVNDIITSEDGAKIQVHGISATDAEGSGNDANLINGASSATVSFTNTYGHVQEKVKFSATKKWATYSGTEIAAPEGAEVMFTLYRTVKDSTAFEEVALVMLTGTASEKPTGENPAGYESAAWTATFINLPNQDANGNTYSYKVKETIIPTGYAPYIGSNPMGDDGYQAQNGGSITNRKQSTDVTVAKVVSGYDPDGQAFSFTAEYGDVTETFSLKGGESYIIKDVPVGAELKVTETEADYFTASYAIGKAEAKEGSSCTYTVAEPADVITFTNTRQTGDLTVTKTVESDLSADKTAEFEFTITLSDKTISGTYGGATFTDGAATVKLQSGKTATITGLPAGITYTVTETAADGFTVEKAGDTGTITTTASPAKFTNTRETGDLTISKTVESPLDADKDIEFSFVIFLTGAGSALSGTYTLEVTPADASASTSVTFTNGAASITLKDGQTAVIKGLPTGVGYEVHESGYEGFAPDPVDSDGYPIVKGTITKSGTSTDFTNTALPGTITVTKTFEGITEAVLPSGFAITVGDKTLKIADADEGSKFPTYTWTLEDMPAGSYTITESGAEVAGYTLTAKYSDDVTLEKGGEAELSVTNTYTLDTGKITITKAAAGLEGTDAVPDTAEFVISGTPDAKDQPKYEKTVTYADLKDGKLTIEDVPAGTYTITESGAEVAGYTLKTEYSGDAVLTKDDETELKVTNTYTPDTGKITLTKEVAGLAGEDAVPDDAEFVISGTPTAKGMPKYQKTVTYADLKDGKLTIEGVPVGTYTVTESGADIAGYALETEYSDEVTLEKDGEAELTVTNTYTRLVLDVKVSKVWDDGDNADETRPAAVTVKLLANGKDTGKTLELSEDNKWEGTFEGVDKLDADGKEISYTVKEDVPEGYIADITGDMTKGFVITNTADVPDTGDHSDLFLWSGAMLTSMLAMAFIVTRRRKEEN